jgi:hypothetical protein
MKGTFFPLKMRSLVAMFFFLGALFFSANRAEAQTFNWMNETQAMSQLAAEVDQLSLDIQNFVPGSTPYKDALNHMSYYKLIQVDIEAGSTVESAVNESLLHINDQFDAANKFLSKATLAALFDDAVILLTN